MIENRGRFDLSVIVPVYREAVIIEELLDRLYAQRGVHLEIIIVDGEPAATTLAAIPGVDRQSSHFISALKSSAGRGVQMNAGARHAQANYLLFLHADSAFPDNRLLASACLEFKAREARRSGSLLAGHFPLKFKRSADDYTAAYHFHEQKTQFNKRWAINGDQGLFIGKSFFEKLGGFHEGLPFLEDQHIAEDIRRQGEWVTLPGHLETSARRFEREGFKQRMTVNMLIVTAFACRLSEFFASAYDLYKRHDQSQYLQTLPFFRQFKASIRAKSSLEQVKLWFRIGRFATANFWQLGLKLDLRLGLTKHWGFPFKRIFESVLAPIVQNPIGTVVAAIGTVVYLSIKTRPSKKFRQINEG